MAPQLIRSTLRGGTPGALLAAPNRFVRIDFGSRAQRQVSLYATSSQGPAALAFAPGDSVQPWDRSADASFGCMTDSYGGARAVNWDWGGLFWEAATQLGCVHLDRDAVGGTGYAPNNTNADTRLQGNTFGARLPDSISGKPDLFLTAGGINDNNAFAALPLYASEAEARAAFDLAVANYFRDLRAALPESVLVATGPWAPRQSVPTDVVTRSKADTIRDALMSVSGPWVFLDNLEGGWRNSAGAAGAADGPWQTGTGTVAAPAGNGNADQYVDADGTHPTEAGALYLGTRIASALRAALQSL